jgi:hypothetical protein
MHAHVCTQKTGVHTWEREYDAAICVSENVHCFMYGSAMCSEKSS